MGKHGLVRATIVLLSGLVMGLATAPVSAWWLAWVAMVPLWVVVLERSLMPVASADSKPWGPYLLLGMLWGMGYHGMALFWITGIHPMTWMGVPWLASLAIAAFCWIFITLWGAALVVLWARLLAGLGAVLPVTRGALCLVLIVAGTTLWCGLESLWSSGSLWWSSLSYTQSPNNLVILHLGQISGPTAVTGTIVAVNGGLAVAWVAAGRYRVTASAGTRHASAHTASTSQASKSLGRRSLGVALGLLVITHLLGWGLYSRPLQEVPTAAVRVGIIQGNIPNTIKLFSEGWRQAIAGYTDGYNQLAEQGVDLVVTPETALPFLWTKPEDAQPSLYRAIRQQNVPALIGGFGKRGARLTNSLFTIMGQGSILSQYDKVKLVPLGEYIPFESLLGRLVDRLSPLDAQLAPGSPQQVFDTSLGRAIVSICYESAFSSYLRQQATQGGELFISVANNAHYSATMPSQHHAQDVQRAIELDRWAVRATNTGYSGIVDPHGVTHWLSDLNTYVLHRDTVYRRTTQTLYLRWGDWLLPVLASITGILIAIVVVTQRREAT